MLGTTVRECHNLDEFWHFARRPTVRETHVTGPGQFFIRSTKVDLQHLWFDSQNEVRCRFQRTETDGRVAIAFVASGDAPMKHQGAELARNEISVLAPGGSLWNGTLGAGTFCAISLPQETLLELGIALAGRDILPKAPVITAKTTSAVFQRLLALHDRTISTAASAPHLLANLNSARAVEADLSEAMVGCLATNCVRPDKASWRQHVRIIKRLRELEEANRGRSLYVTEVCMALRVNAR